MKRVYIKLLAVIMAAALLTVSYGIEKLTSFERGAADYENKREENTKNENNANVKSAKENLDKRRNPIKSRELGEIPFLVKSIKYKRIESNETIVFESANQKLEYYLPLSLCVYYSYDCSIADCRLDTDECRSLAVKAVYKVFSSFKNFIVTGAELIAENEKICTFSVKTSLSGDERIEISLRRDTGSVVLYDGQSAVDSIERVIAAGWGNLYGKI